MQPKKKLPVIGNAGDCVDCGACVAVCPTGIDIRDGNQLECIQCALCIDACDDIMHKIGRPDSLIGYDTFRNFEAASHHERAPLHIVRPRTILYSALIALVMGIMTWAWLAREEVGVTLIQDRNPLYVALSDGGVRNGYTIKILNKNHKVHTFRVSVEGLPQAKMSLVGFEHADTPVEVETDTVRALKLYVTVPREARDALSGGATPFHIVVEDLSDGNRLYRATSFRSAQ
jgi:cytochrome c oxidase accessory protein FixG